MGAFARGPGGAPDRCPRGDEPGNGGGRIALAKPLFHLSKQSPGFLVLWSQSRPGEIDTVEEIALGRVARERLEVVQPRAAPLGGAETLALVHAAGESGDLRVGLPEKRVVAA